MNKKYITILMVIILVLGLGGWYLYTQKQLAQSDDLGINTEGWLT